MARPEIVMETPAAKQLEAAVQRKLAEFSYSTADDVVMAEYVVVMLANAKTPAEITAELTELIGEDMYDPIFTDWLFEELARQYGPPPNASAPVVESAVEIPTKSSQAGTSDRSNSDLPAGGKIETVNDSREPSHSNRNTVKRVGNNGTNGNRTSQGVFNQALGGLKRSGGTDILKDTPPHRRLRSDEPFSGGGIPTGPRSMDRDSRDGGRPNLIPPRNGGGMTTDRRDANNNGPRPPHNNFPPMRPGFGANPDVGAKSILERVGVLGNGIRPFANHNFQGGFDNGQPRRMNDQLGDSLNGGRPPMPPNLHAPFYNPGAPYPGPMTPNHPFPQHQYQQPSPNAPTPQLFLANGQPFIPSHPITHPISAGGGQIPPMYHQVLMNVPTTPNSGLSAQSPAFNPGQSMGYVPKGAPLSQSATPDLNLSPLPDKPSLRQECKYNLECKDAWCPSSHCSPCGDSKSSMLLNFDACEKQMQCQDSDCPKAHVSPQQRDPKSSIRIPVITNAAAPNTSTLQASTPAPSSNLTPCRFGTQCTRADCHFTHPWNTNPNTPGAAGEVGKAPTSTPFSTIRCKYAMACTRPNCHFQHPPKKTAAASYRTPSKNISKTFNSSDIVSAPNGIDAAKLPPSKKFAAPQPEQGESSNNAEEKVEKGSDASAMSLKPKVEAELSVANPSSSSAKPSIKTEANNGLPHQATSELSDIKPVLPVSVST